MHDLRTTYPDTWNELVGGSLSVSKNGIPTTSVGADHACEHLNRQMKVKSALVGIHGRRSVGDGGGRVPPTFQLGGDHIGNVPPTFLLKKWKISCVLSPSNLHSLSACVIDTGVYK